MDSGVLINITWAIAAVIIVAMVCNMLSKP